MTNKQIRGTLGIVFIMVLLFKTMIVPPESGGAVLQCVTFAAVTWAVGILTWTVGILNGDE